MKSSLKNEEVCLLCSDNYHLSLYQCKCVCKIGQHRCGDAESVSEMICMNVLN